MTDIYVLYGIQHTSSALSLYRFCSFAQGLDGWAIDTTGPPLPSNNNGNNNNSHNNKRVDWLEKDE